MVCTPSEHGGFPTFLDGKPGHPGRSTFLACEFRRAGREREYPSLRELEIRRHVLRLLGVSYPCWPSVRWLELAARGEGLEPSQ